MADTVKGSVVSVQLQVSFRLEFDLKKAYYAFDWPLFCLQDIRSD